MVAKAREIDVRPGSELARIIDESNTSTVYLVKDGVRYRLERAVAEERVDGELSNGDEDEDEDAILDKIVGAWSDVDADAMIEMLRRAREEGSRPIDQAPKL